jgi:hypothetical protein
LLVLESVYLFLVDNLSAPTFIWSGILRYSSFAVDNLNIKILKLFGIWVVNHNTLIGKEFYYLNLDSNIKDWYPSQCVSIIFNVWIIVLKHSSVWQIDPGLGWPGTGTEPSLKKIKEVKTRVTRRVDPVRFGKKSSCKHLPIFLN